MRHEDWRSRFRTLSGEERDALFVAVGREGRNEKGRIKGVYRMDIIECVDGHVDDQS